MTLREDALEQLFAAAAASSKAYLCALPDGLHLKVVLRGQRYMLGAWMEGGKRLQARECEEIGEDAGFFDPRFKPWAWAEAAHGMLIVEGFTGQLCGHKWSTNAHFDGRNEFGNILRCAACGVVLTDTHSRRGNRHTYNYDAWEVRHHIWRRWAKRGPVPGSMQPQAHHEKKPKKQTPAQAKEKPSEHPTNR